MKIIKFEDTAFLVENILYINKWDNTQTKRYFILIKFKGNVDLQWSYQDENERLIKYNNLIKTWTECI